MGERGRGGEGEREVDLTSWEKEQQEQRRWTHVLPLDVRSLLVPLLPRGLRFLLGRASGLDEFARLDLVAAAEGTWALEYAAEEGRVDIVRELWAEHGRMGVQGNAPLSDTQASKNCSVTLTIGC